LIKRKRWSSGKGRKSPMALRDFGRENGNHFVAFIPIDIEKGVEEYGSNRFS